MFTRRIYVYVCVFPLPKISARPKLLFKRFCFIQLSLAWNHLCVFSQCAFSHNARFLAMRVFSARVVWHAWQFGLQITVSPWLAQLLGVLFAEMARLRQQQKHLVTLLYYIMLMLSCCSYKEEYCSF
jgi:uncharacterized membrane protein (DUF485 family)